MLDQTTLAVALLGGVAGGFLSEWLRRQKNRLTNRLAAWKRARDPRGYHERYHGPGSYDEMLELRAWMESGRKGPPPMVARRAKQQAA